MSRARWGGQGEISRGERASVRHMIPSSILRSIISKYDCHQGQISMPELSFLKITSPYIVLVEEIFHLANILYIYDCIFVYLQ